MKEKFPPLLLVSISLLFPSTLQLPSVRPRFNSVKLQHNVGLWRPSQLDVCFRNSTTNCGVSVTFYAFILHLDAYFSPSRALAHSAMGAAILDPGTQSGHLIGPTWTTWRKLRLAWTEIVPPWNTDYDDDLLFEKISTTRTIFNSICKIISTMQKAFRMSCSFK